MTRQIVGAQVGQALELEKQLVQASRAPVDKEPVAADMKGTILPISAGVAHIAGGAVLDKSCHGGGSLITAPFWSQRSVRHPSRAWGRVSPGADSNAAQQIQQ
ncbi:MAG: hypothetical protein U0361_07285 [Nitrospiraceae bacterium]